MNTNNSSSYIQVKNSGVFFASFNVVYLLGDQVYNVDSYEFGSGITKRINIPPNATNITVEIQIAEFIGVWATIMTTIFQSSGQYCFQTSGTTISPYCQQISCQDSSNVGDGTQQSCCCCCCCCQCPTQSSNTNTCYNPCS